MSNKITRKDFSKKISVLELGATFFASKLNGISIYAVVLDNTKTRNITNDFIFNNATNNTNIEPFQSGNFIQYILFCKKLLLCLLWKQDKIKITSNIKY